MSILKQKTHKAFTLIELSIVTLVTPILLGVISTYLITGLHKYKQTQATTFLLQENVKILKTIGGIRFAFDTIGIDETSDITTLTLDMGEKESISFAQGAEGTALEDDIIFTNKTGQVISMYDNRFISIKKFKAIELDNTVNRKGIRFSIDIAMVGKENRRVAKKFGKNINEHIKYDITYTYRNKPVEES